MAAHSLLLDVRRSRRRRTAALAAGLALATVALGGCAATNPITTELVYSASDGVRAEIGAVVANNVLILAAAEGAPGTLLGAVTNNGASATQVLLGLEGGDPEILTVDANSTVLLGGTSGQTLAIDSVPAMPGATTAMTLATASGGAVTFDVPVLDGTLPQYTDLVPATE